MIFKTQSGSTYEVYSANKRIRRLYGKLSPTPYQPADGEWKAYESISSIERGKGVLIIWSFEGLTPVTFTSNVVSVDPNLKEAN
jgi:hypothetical protein